MMQKLTYLALAGLVLSFQACGTLSTLPAIDLPSAASNLPSVPMQKKLSQDEAAPGRKEALIKGVGVGTDQLQKTGGFSQNSVYKILLPPEIQENALRKDPIQRSSELLKKVFDYAVKNQN